MSVTRIPSGGNWFELVEEHALHDDIHRRVAQPTPSTFPPVGPEVTAERI